MKQDDERLRILICIGGGPEAYAGLRYAARLSKKTCANIDLLYVRQQDSGLQSGGMEVRVARENILDWGLELPGMTHLKKARDILVELGEITPDANRDWRHLELSGDPAGEYVREYENPCGGTISLRLRTATDVVSVITNEADLCDVDMIIVGASPEPLTGLKKFLSRKPLALQVAAHSKHSVIVARHLEPGHGHLVCVQDTERSRAMLSSAVRYAHACQCPVSILSVAPAEADRPSAQKSVDEAAALFLANGITPHETLVEVGDAVDTIITIGYDFSLILLPESPKPWFSKGSSVTHEVAEKARNSVMIVK
ncbi:MULTISPECIES: universal stress protein [unclassified Pseudodesulfovibrio]|uniref:universal stress protein n=1 Tax=unclassified Pseudodesulfovibrio TaxID=2661612 RepID=UPI000FEB9823|nr:MULTISPECIES: universal stress protein [unclassified Pseudodesulfovibrio]MCJ2165987.1 universal stress protein [Pseudodesulfovibrio sp. S3-i]RWU02575.1 universal stress protein [Pseudodesulfovibrio sp. S3]